MSHYKNVSIVCYDCDNTIVSLGDKTVDYLPNGCTKDTYNIIPIDLIRIRKIELNHNK